MADAIAVSPADAGNGSDFAGGAEMRYLILLPHIRIENANAVAGLTWGFSGDKPFPGVRACAFP